MQKTPEQQIDEAMESLKTLLVPQARNQQDADEIIRRLNSLGHEAKAVSAIVNDHNIYKAAIKKLFIICTSKHSAQQLQTIKSLILNKHPL